MASIIDSKVTIRSSEIKSQEEKRRLTLLQEILGRSNILTNGMVSTLDNFERKLNSLDELVTPVYEATNELHLLLNNIDKSLSSVDSIVHYYDICSELTPTISSGPAGNLADYLAELDRLEDAVKYFKRTTAVSERERVVHLFNLGRERLVDETDKLILRYANPLSSKELLELYELSQRSNITDVHAMQEADMGVLRKIIEWFSSHGFRQGLIDSYATKRSNMIRRSLELLSEDLSKASNRRGSNVAGSLSPNISQSSASSSDMSKKTSKKLGDMGRRLIRSSGSSGLPRSSASPLSISATMIDENTTLDINDDSETNNYKTLLNIFIVLLKRDRDLLNYVFPTDLQTLVFAKLIEPPLTYMHKEAERLCISILGFPNKLDTSKFAVYGLFSVLNWFLNSRQKFAELFRETNDTRRQQFSTLSATFERSAVQVLRSILEEITGDSSPLSQGGNVHPLTSHVLAFMEGLLAYEDTAKIIASLYIEQTQRSTSSSFTGNEKGLFDLGIYFAQLISGLHTCLSKKIDTFISRNDNGLRAVFLLNNVNYLLKRLENSPLLGIIQRCQPDLKSKYEIDIQTNLNDFTKCFSPLVKAIHQMLEYNNNVPLPDIRLRDRDREQLKQSFSDANAAIDGIRQQCEKCIISDVSLRKRLRDEAKSSILEMYKTFYEKFAHKEFTKHRERYIQYDPRALETIIDKFFENQS